MRDLRGIMRKHCCACGEDVCDEFLKVQQTPFCGYCGCPPTKHEKVLDSAKNTDEPNLRPNTNLTADDPSIKSEIHPIELDDTIPTPSVCIEDRIIYLPEFSPRIKDALLKGKIRQRRLWFNFIKECAMHYKDCTTLNTKTAYDYIGSKMFEQYPCIESTGPKPWSEFNKSLSQKVRSLRCLDKSFRGTTIRNGFQNSTAKEIEKTKKLCVRSEVKISAASDEEIPKIKNMLKEECMKDWPDKDLIKSFLRGTFDNRTELLRKGECVMNEYACLKESEYILHEFSLLIGSRNLIEARERMKTFFENLSDLDSYEYPKEVTLSKWLCFEKKVNKQSRKKQFSEILKIAEAESEYFENMKEVENPCAWLLLKDGTIKDATVLYQNYTIEVKAAYVPYILTVLLAIYYCFELNYPAVYLQAMGTLGSYVLRHNYCKLGKQALNVLSKLK